MVGFLLVALPFSCAAIDPTALKAYLLKGVRYPYCLVPVEKPLSPRVFVTVRAEISQ